MLADAFHSFEKSKSVAGAGLVFRTDGATSSSGVPREAEGDARVVGLNIPPFALRRGFSVTVGWMFFSGMDFFNIEGGCTGAGSEGESRLVVTGFMKVSVATFESAMEDEAFVFPLEDTVGPSGEFGAWLLRDSGALPFDSLEIVGAGDGEELKASSTMVMGMRLRRGVP